MIACTDLAIPSYMSKPHKVHMLTHRLHPTTEDQTLKPTPLDANVSHVSHSIVACPRPSNTMYDLRRVTSQLDDYIKTYRPPTPQHFSGMNNGSIQRHMMCPVLYIRSALLQAVSKLLQARTQMVCRPVQTMFSYGQSPQMA